MILIVMKGNIQDSIVLGKLATPIGDARKVDSHAGN